MKRYGILCLIFALVLFAFSMAGQTQEKYPHRPIEVVVPFGPGGVADVIARIYSEELSRELKVSITVVNRAGGTGIQGTIYVINSKKDGYTLLGAAGTSLYIMPAISKEATYDSLKELFPLGHFGSVPNMFSVRSDSPFQTLNELVEYARKNPGKLKNAASGLGNEGYFNVEILCAKNNIKIPTIPFKSGGESAAAVLGGHTDLTADTLLIMGPHIKAGKLRGLAVTSKTRHPDFPNIPTTAELGHPDVNFRVWLGIYAPAGVPQQVLDVLIPVVEKVFNNPDVVRRATNAGLTVEFMGPEKFRKFIESAIIVAEKVAKEANIVVK